MGIWEYLTTFGESNLFGRYYKTNRLLFLVYSLLVVAGVWYVLSISPDAYVYSECKNSTADFCINNAFGSPVCSKPEFKDLPVCTQEKIYIDHTQKVYSLGEKPPWYLKDYTTLMIGGLWFIILLNTIFHNAHLFHKRRDDEPTPKDFVMDVLIGKDGLGDVIENDINKRSDGEGQGSDSELHQADDGAREQSGSRPEVESGSEDRVADSLQSDEKPSRFRAGSRFR